MTWGVIYGGYSIENNKEVYKDISNFYEMHQNGRASKVYWEVVKLDIHRLSTKHKDDKLFIKLIAITVKTLKEEYDTFKNNHWTNTSVDKCRQKKAHVVYLSC